MQPDEQLEKNRLEGRVDIRWPAIRQRGIWSGSRKQLQIIIGEFGDITFANHLKASREKVLAKLIGSF